MQLILTAPLQVKAPGRKLHFLPVNMNGVNPSETSAGWLSFLKAKGERILLHQDEIAKIQKYMRQHGTESVSEDGVVAYTVAVLSLLECDLKVIGSDCDA